MDTPLRTSRELGTGTNGLCTLGISWDDVHKKQQARNLRKWMSLKKVQRDWQEPQAAARSLSPRDEREQHKARREVQKEKMQTEAESVYREEKALSNRLSTMAKEIGQERLQSVYSMKALNKTKHSEAIRTSAEKRQIRLEQIRNSMNVQRVHDEREMNLREARETRSRRLLRAPQKKVAAEQLRLEKVDIVASEKLARQQRKEAQLQFLKQDIKERSASIKASHAKRVQHMQETKQAREDRLQLMKRVQRQAFLTSAKDILAQRLREDESRKQTALLSRQNRTPTRALSPMSSIPSPSDRVHLDSLFC